jgi:hypothetical protein
MGLDGGADTIQHDDASLSSSGPALLLVVVGGGNVGRYRMVRDIFERQCDKRGPSRGSAGFVVGSGRWTVIGIAVHGRRRCTTHFRRRQKSDLVLC